MEEMFHGLVLESLGVAVKFFRGEAFGGSEHWIFCVADELIKVV